MNNAYRHPRPGMWGRGLASVLNSPGLRSVRRAVLSRLPFLRMESEAFDVVYLTWWVSVAACERFVPAGLRLWQHEGLTPFTVLSYRHAHFGPSLLGPLRRLCPSPLQSNWRLYLAAQPDAGIGPRTVLFLKNVMNSLPYTVATRLFSDALPTHQAERFVHREAAGVFETLIAPGQGSAPALEVRVRRGGDRRLSGARLARCFAGWDEAVAFLAHQQAAVAPVEGLGRIAHAEIDLPIDLATVVPAEVDGAVHCPWLGGLQPDGPPFCFIVPQVRFRVLSERLL